MVCPQNLLVKSERSFSNMKAEGPHRFRERTEWEAKHEALIVQDSLKKFVKGKEREKWVCNQRRLKSTSSLILFIFKMEEKPKIKK